MAWIDEIEPNDATGELADAYAEVAGSRGVVANLFRAHSVHPSFMTMHLALYRELMFGPSELTRAERETIAVAVSSVNECFY